MKTFVLGWLLIASPVFAQTPEPSLGEVAAREAIRRATAPKASARHTYTSSTTQDVKPATAGAPIVQHSTDVVDPRKTEAYWHTRMTILSIKYETARKAYYEAVGRMQSAQANAANGPRTALWLSITGPQIFAAQAEVEKAGVPMQDAFNAIEALKEEGRVADALPGWFR